MVLVLAFLRRTSFVPMAINAGGLSPIGEPLAMFPPKVAEFRTCVDAYRVSNGVRLGCASTLHNRICSIVTLAPNFQ